MSRIRKFGREYSHKFLKTIFQNEKTLLIALMFVGLIFVFLFLRKIVLPIVFIPIGVFSMYLYGTTRSMVAFELVTLFAVVTGIAYGGFAGALVGGISCAIGMIVFTHADWSYPLWVTAVAIAGYSASFFSPENVIFAGVLLAFLVDAFFYALYLLLAHNPVKLTIWITSHTFLNYIAFLLLAKPLLAIMMV
ncbi:TPA: hypothetical protein HA246_06295 [Candidatus Woesearchaeota archaeon]|nr:hypothetical protein [Candidatus Woesearchaeota archaeon]